MKKKGFGEKTTEICTAGAIKTKMKITNNLK